MCSDATFRCLDRDEDGQITFDDYRRLCIGYPTLLSSITIFVEEIENIPVDTSAEAGFVPGKSCPNVCFLVVGFISLSFPFFSKIKRNEKCFISTHLYLSQSFPLRMICLCYYGALFLFYSGTRRGS